MIKHRVECAADGCGRVWRENCSDCAQDIAESHRRHTGHAVTLAITEARNWQEVRQMAEAAHRVLMLRGQKKGW